VENSIEGAVMVGFTEGPRKIHSSRAKLRYANFLTSKNWTFGTFTSRKIYKCACI